MLEDVLNYLPSAINEEIRDFYYKNEEEGKKIEEIRLRINQKLSIKICENKKVLKTKITNDILKEAFENICEKSVYSYTKQIAEGFITLKGGNRVGIIGTPVIEDEKIINMKYISSLNFRIAKQLKDVSLKFLKYIIDIENDTIFNTLIASPPGARKNNNIKRFNFKNVKWDARDRIFT